MFAHLFKVTFREAHHSQGITSRSLGSLTRLLGLSEAEARLLACVLPAPAGPEMIGGQVNFEFKGPTTIRLVEQ
jgi:hypothetical protein